MRTNVIIFDVICAKSYKVLADVISDVRQVNLVEHSNPHVELGNIINL